MRPELGIKASMELNFPEDSLALPCFLFTLRHVFLEALFTCLRALILSSPTVFPELSYAGSYNACSDIMLLHCPSLSLVFWNLECPEQTLYSSQALTMTAGAVILFLSMLSRCQSFCKSQLDVFFFTELCWHNPFMTCHSSRVFGVLRSYY